MKSIMRKIKKKCFLIILGLAVLIVSLLVFRLWYTRGYKSAAGIYLTTAGQSYIVIEPGHLGSLRVKEGFFISYYWFFLPSFSHKIAGEGPVSLDASYKNGRLIVRQRIKKKKVFGREYYTEFLNLLLKPSESIPGDWDLVDSELIVFSGVKLKITSKSFWKKLFKSDDFKEFRETIANLFEEESMYFRLDPSKAPVRSFLHSIDDNRIPRLYNSLLRGDYTGSSLDTARNLVRKFPNDPYLDLLLVDMEALSDNAEKSFQLYTRWLEKYRGLSCPLLDLAGNIVWRNVSNSMWRKNTGKKGFHYNKIFDMKKGMEQRNSEIRELFHAEDFPFYPLSEPFVRPLKKHDYAIPDMVNFIALQVHSKVCRALAVSCLFQGRFSESLDFLGCAYHLGQSLVCHGNFITRIIGIAICSITSNGLEYFVLNACQEPEDFKEFRSILEKLNKSPIQEKKTPLLEGEHPLLLLMMNISGKSIPNIEGVSLKHNVSGMKFQLVRMATAAKHHLIAKGDFPETKKDFEAFLEDAIPKDAFGENTDLLYTKHSKDAFYVYSVGPDKTDNKAAFSYDPTNGTVSGGDIFIRIPREREFPFPREGVRAKNAYELLDQFPNGLPADIFADEKGRPFSIMESTETSPVMILSFGPDTDEADFKPFTKGITKEGSEVFEPVPTPPPPKDASYGRSLQWIMRRTEKYPAPPGYWKIKCPYDPTNGTISPGDIYIEIPK